MGNSAKARATSSRTAGSDSPGGVQSVDRAVTVLEILAREGSAGVSEVAVEIGVHKSTAFRLLSALEDRDLVVQNAERGKYQLGFGVLRLASAMPARLDVVQQARPVLDDLARELDETINLAVVSEHYAVNLHQVLGSAAVASQNWVGQLTPLHATSSGKVLLAFAEPALLEQVLDAVELSTFTTHTKSSRLTLMQELSQVRRDGHATALEELEEGLNAVAAPVRNHLGEVVAAISASGPAYRFDREAIGAALPQLTAAADLVSRRLGWHG